MQITPHFPRIWFTRMVARISFPVRRNVLGVSLKFITFDRKTLLRILRPRLFQIEFPQIVRKNSIHSSPSKSNSRKTKLISTTRIVLSSNPFSIPRKQTNKNAHSDKFPSFILNAATNPEAKMLPKQKPRKEIQGIKTIPIPFPL